jgi:hypothetical protein
LAAELTKRGDNQALIDELGRGLRREAMQMRQVAEEASRILARYVGRTARAEGLLGRTRALIGEVDARTTAGLTGRVGA